MTFVERAFAPITKAISSAFGGGGGGAAPAPVPAAPPAPKPMEAPPLPTAPAPPKGPLSFAPGAAPGAKQKAAVTGTSILGAAAAAGQTAQRRAVTVLG